MRIAAEITTAALVLVLVLTLANWLTSVSCQHGSHQESQVSYFDFGGGLTPIFTSTTVCD